MSISGLYAFLGFILCLIGFILVILNIDKALIFASAGALLCSLSLILFRE